MAARGSEGFDAYNGVGTLTGLQSRWATVSAGALSLVAGRFGGQALRVSAGTGSAPERSLGYSSANHAHGFAWRFQSIPTGTQVLGHYILKSGATYQCGIGLNTSGGISAYRLSADGTGTLLGSSANGIIAVGAWNYFEVETVISTTVGRITVYMNGNPTPILNITGVNTANAGVGTTADTVRFPLTNGSTGLTSFDIDDMYFDDSATKRGERRVETIYPTSDISVVFSRSTGAQNFALVDEPQVNGDTDYVQGSVVGDTDRYGFGDLSSLPATIDGIQLCAFALKTDAATRAIYLQVKSGATTSDGSSFSLAATYGKFERFLATDPNTSAAWTAANVNLVEGGPKVAA